MVQYIVALEIVFVALLRTGYTILIDLATSNGVGLDPEKTLRVWSGYSCWIGDRTDVITFAILDTFHGLGAD